MLGVDQRGKRCFRRVVPLARGSLAAGVLRGRDDFEILILELGVEFLPAWQIQTAASPGGPGDYEHLLAAQAGEVDDVAAAVGDREIGSDARAVEIATHHGNFAEAPDGRYTATGVDNVRTLSIDFC